MLTALAFALGVSTPALAIFHDIKVKEVFVGTAANPNAQYVLLQAFNANQNAVNGHSVLRFAADGTPLTTVTFGSNVGNGGDQMTILVATAEAAALFNLTADFTMDAVLNPAGGKVCWEGSTPDDCVAWGLYTGSATGVGTPYNQTGGLIPGYAAQRRLDICLAIAELDGCDDTDDSADDFITAVPNPIQNNGTPGQTPASTCGNNILEGLEGCDDNNTNGGDGCSAVCQPEPISLIAGGLSVDRVQLTPDTSNVNGVFEPGESVRIDPTWANSAPGGITLTGQLTNFTGPTANSPVYMVSDGAADYGTINSGSTVSCDPTSNCYRVYAANSGARPAQHWDAAADEILDPGALVLREGGGGGPAYGVQTWALHLGNSFPDVPSDVPAPHIFYNFIENLFHNGVTGGCAGGNYCPENGVTRAQMAVFLLKAKFGSNHVPPPCTGGIFDDVPCTGGPFDPWIEELASLQITGGCGGGNYCPNNTVTRAQMAVFLLKTLEGFAYDPPDCAGVFDDVPCTPGTGFSDWIEELFARQITGGCSMAPPLYCPDNPNNRGQMAVFLVKTFSLLLYGFPPPVF
jgi:cysteine-rich repeat protein